MRADSWEHGSDFHWVDPPPHAAAGGSDVPWGAGARAYGSGRDALRALLRWGQAQKGWERLWVPSYFCQDVIAAMQHEALPLLAYTDTPLRPGPELHDDLRHGDALLWVNHFGLRGPFDRSVVPSGVILIEDHTHDPFGPAAAQSQADWCIASLRKTLALPDGGLLWSPRNHALPAAGTESLQREEASLRRFTGMQLKRLYLQGQPVAKETYRRLLLQGEAGMGGGEIAAMTDWSSALLALLVGSTAYRTAQRAARQANVRAAAETLEACPWLQVLAAYHPEAIPFSVVLVFDEAARCAEVRRRLIAARVYPAVLWPLEARCIDGIGEEEISLSRRLLSLHADTRYTPDDMRAVAALVERFGSIGEQTRV